VKYVLDASVALKWVLPEADSPMANRLRSEYHAGLHVLLAPDIFPVEIAHALTKAERQKTVPVGQGWLLWQDIIADCPSLVPSIPLLPRAYAIAAQMRIGIYDCLYVALAEQQSCVLLTADTRMLNALRQQFPFITDLATLP
jgi:predicted nucleic acid-binding protein